MKRWMAMIAAVCLTVMCLPITAVAAAEETLPYALPQYGHRVKLLGGATLTDDGAAVSLPLDGVAFYSRCHGEVAVETSASAEMDVYVDAVYQGRVTVDGRTIVAHDVSDGMHRVELVLCERKTTVIRTLWLNAELTAVPPTPRMIVFDGDMLDAVDMMTVSRVIGMDAREANETDIDREADVVVTSRDEREEDVKERYPRARIVFVGTEADDARYSCDGDAQTLARYIRTEVVPQEYYDELATYVELSEERLQKHRPTADAAAKLRLELSIAQANDGVSGILYTLHEDVKNGPKAGWIPNYVKPEGVNTFVLIGCIIGGVMVVGVGALLVAVTRKPKDKTTESKEESS